MKGCLAAAGIVLLALLLIGGCGVGAYNGIVAKDEVVSASWSQVQNQYQRRSELVPQLVETVKGAAGFEQSTLGEITAARASVGKLTLPGDKASEAELQAFFKAQDQLSGALSRLLVVAESYPTLKATESFRDLASQLEGTENRIAVARRDYIDAVREYNVAIRRFPGALVAGAFGFAARAQLEAPAGASERPEVRFDFGEPK
jgi:LemA protein